MLELPPDYYLVNFRRLIDFVAETYCNLLSPTEHAFYRNFVALPEDAQRLYIRLLCRTKSVFRAAKLNYPEIGDIHKAAEHLQQRGFLSIDAHLDLELVVPLFTRVELVRRLQLTDVKNAKRPEIEESVRNQHDSALTVKLLMQDESVYQVLCEDVFAVFRLCFFGNLYQDMTDFVLQELGLTEFEPYTIDSETRAFQSREQIEAHLQYYRCADNHDALPGDANQALLDLHGELPEASDFDATLKRRIDRLTNTIARQLERNSAFASALDLYRQSDRPPSRERQARVHALQGDYDNSLAVCRRILHSPHDEEEAFFAMQFGARIAKKSGDDWSTPVKYSPPVEQLQLVASDDRVEIICAEHYATQGQCYYTENTLFNGIFGLVFWDIIFVQLPGVFFNPFQSAPADFYDPQFRLRRKSLLDERFSELTSADVIAGRAWSVYASKQGLQNPLVQWRYLDKALMEMALSRIPLAHWVAIFHRLLTDLRGNRAGFTDLILFPDSTGYELIEVKGPGDTLQKNQLRWMQFFSEHQINHRVAHVSWLEASEDSR